MMIEPIAQAGSPSQFGPRMYPKSSLMTRPKTLISMSQNQRRIQLKTLNVPSSIQSHTRVLSTVGTMNGRRTAARVKRESRNLRLSSTASHIPSAALIAVAVMVKKTVFQAAVRKMSLSRSFAKFARPMKLPGDPTTLSVRAIQTPSANG